MLVLAMEFSRINSERLHAHCIQNEHRRGASLPQNGIEEKSGSNVRGRSLPSRSRRIASDQLGAPSS